MKTPKFRILSWTKKVFSNWSFLNKFSDVKWLHPWYDLKYGISNLKFYFNIVWNTRDYDYMDVLGFMELKLSRMEALIRDHGHHLDSNKDVDNIHKTRLAIKRIIADEYHENVYMFHDKKWGNSHFNFIPCDDRSGYSELEITRDNATTPEQKEQETKEYRLLMRRPDYLKKQDLEYVTKMINKYLFRWWD